MSSWLFARVDWLEFEASARKKLAEVAIAELGISPLDSKYLRVGEAAKSLGLENWYAACNAHFSKLAHPTGGLVVGLMHLAETTLRGIQSTCTTEELYFAGECERSV